jgi:hypothetical protein
MPIKGISEIRRVPRLGKIRLGEKKLSQAGKEYPAAVDYFVCKADESTPAAAAEAFRSVYGDKPREIDVMFPVDDLEKVFPNALRCYKSGAGLYCRGDGEVAQRRTEDGQWMDVACPYEDCELFAKKHCRPVGTLQFLLPKVPGVGVWQIDTSSFHSIVNLNSGIDFIRSLTGGRFAGLMLKLRVVAKEVSPDGKKKTVFVMELKDEEARLADVLAASTKTMAQLLLPEVNLDEIPDDLFPAAAEAQRLGVAGELPAPTAEVRAPAKEPEVVDNDEGGTDPELIANLNRAWDILGTPEAKRKGVLNSGKDLTAILKELNTEIDMRATVAEQEAANGNPLPADSPAGRAANSRRGSKSNPPATSGSARQGQPAQTEQPAKRPSLF